MILNRKEEVVFLVLCISTRPQIAMGKAIKGKEEKLLRLFSSLKNLFFIITISIWCTFLFVYIREGRLVNIEGISMCPTYEDKQYVLQEEYPNEIYRYDVIKFLAPGDDENNLYIKRVYGLPGEKIQIKENNIYVNGKVLNDPYFNGEIKNYGYANEEITLGENEYFVLGDNRNESIDSRDFICGKIPRALICSKIITK